MTFLNAETFVMDADLAAFAPKVVEPGRHLVDAKVALRNGKPKDPRVLLATRQRSAREACVGAFAAKATPTVDRTAA